jgi:hypothetical protein
MLIRPLLHSLVYDRRWPCAKYTVLPKTGRERLRMVISITAGDG